MILVRAGLEHACKEFSARIALLGFERTLKMCWTRRNPLTIEFIHLHRGGSSYGAPINASVDIRLHLGIRVINDDLVAAAQNGPSSDQETARAGRYHLRFNADSGSTFHRCVDDLVRFVEEQGEPWFQRFRAVETLLSASDSPLGPKVKEALVAAQAGSASVERGAASLKLLGMR